MKSLILAQHIFENPQFPIILIFSECPENISNLAQPLNWD